MKENKKIKVLFCCMGNICRSPTAEVVFRQTVRQAGLESVIDCDSAGTHNYHVDELPDERTRRAALRRGYDMSALRGRQVDRQDFERFDYVLAMDRQNLAVLKRLCPAQYAHKLALYCDYHEQYRGQEVPDPYFGGTQGFEQVLDMTEKISMQLLKHLKCKLI